MTITKSDLATIIVYETGCTKAGADRAMDALLARIVGALHRGIDVQIRGFATIFTVHRKARLNARNPRTGEVVAIPERISIKFKPAKALSDALNGK